MRTLNLVFLVCLGAAFSLGCQMTVDDLRPFHLRQGGGENPETKPEPEPEPKPEPPKATGKDVIYALGLNGID